MRDRPWYDQCRAHAVLTPEMERHACPACLRIAGSCICFPAHYLYLRDETAPPSDPGPRGGNEERAFVTALNAHLLDVTTRLVFADWLDEHGRRDEAAVLRDRLASPIVTPFRVLPYWRTAPFFARLRRRRQRDADETILARRLATHDDVHGGGVWARPGARATRVLVLDDTEAVLAGIDQWPLQRGEREPIVRSRTARRSWWRTLLVSKSNPR